MTRAHDSRHHLSKPNRTHIYGCTGISSTVTYMHFRKINQVRLVGREIPNRATSFDFIDTFDFPFFKLCPKSDKIVKIMS